MKKVLFIMAAAFLMMTQCRKENATPNMPADGAVKMTVTAGPGRTDINTATGAITWSEDDRLYVSNGAIWLGSLTLVDGAGTANGTFSGSVTGLDDEGDACHFFYLGHDNGMTELTGTATANISFAAQDGTLDGAMKYHIGYGNTSVTVTEGEATGSVIMNTKIAIAHINFTDGTSAYTGSLTMGGTGIFNTLSVNPDGTFSGSGDEGITIGNGGGTTGERYVTLIPTETTEVLNVSFTGDATGGMTFAKGIHENKFYGMSSAIEVTVEAAAPAAVFSVGPNTTVEFAPGNLWYGIADGESTPAFHFEANQWSTKPTSNGQWDANHVSHFFWSKDAAEAIKEEFDWGQSMSMSTDDVFFTEVSGFQVNGYEANTWRTLTNDEWNYLLNSRTGASSLRAWVTLSNVSVSGLVLLPDGSTATASGITTSSALADAGAVFLPAAGRRDGADVHDAGSHGYYWSSTPNEVIEDFAYFLYFFSGYVSTDYDIRNGGFAVRLVR